MDDRQRALIRHAWPRQLVFTLLIAAALFAAAGSIAYWQGWAFLACFDGASVALGAYFAWHDPALLERRMKAGPRAETEPAQKIIITLIMIGFALLMFVPPLEYRWYGAAAPGWLSAFADLGIVASFVSFFFVMKQNSYAASSVRVESAQPVISTGLYGVVRHPMYTGALLLTLCMPVALGSFHSLMLVALMVPVLAWRLLDEERVLKRDLPGYVEYCRRVRWRLIPFVW